MQEHKSTGVAEFVAVVREFLWPRRRPPEAPPAPHDDRRTGRTHRMDAQRNPARHADAGRGPHQQGPGTTHMERNDSAR